MLSGDIGRHGIAIMAVREGLAFESAIESDCAPLWGPVQAILDAGVHVQIDERAIPVRDDVRGACEILGFDPLYVANEGRFIAFLPYAEAERALVMPRAHPLGAGASLIGSVTEGTPGYVTMRSVIGASRIVDMLSGEQLPRIC